MLKGHTTIELRDVVTGEVKKYEDDNMMTNYISKVVNFACTHALGDSPLNPYTSHWYNMLGGLCLFSQTLTEDADAFYLPAGVTPIGYGIQGDTNSYTDVNAWGIYNTQESDTSQANMKKMVWDFSTSHANGIISSVALTHVNNGLWGFGIPENKDTQRNQYSKIAAGTSLTKSSKGRQGRNDANSGQVGSNMSLSDGTYVDFCIDADNDKKYMMKVCQDGLSIINFNMYPEKFNVFRFMSTNQSYEEDTYSETFGSGFYYHFYNTDEQVLYFWILSQSAYSFSNSVTINIHKFDMQTHTLTKNWKTNVTLTGTTVYNGFAITNTGLYYQVYDSANPAGSVIKKYIFSGGATTTLVKLTSNFRNQTMLCAYILNGLIYIPGFRSWGTGSNGYDVIVDTSDDSIRYSNVSSYFNQGSNEASKWYVVPPIDNTQAIFGTYLGDGETLQQVLDLQGTGATGVTKGNMFATVHYLGTINNLSEAIVKTAQQTMKITYTITEESNG